ncbi:hypothetical protein GpartN1_g5647.t1 [Galdieria partita]|uniref:BRK domain-containing protein n=1 Tax=Galdieria partita TaxID=83374 RepID=A0A9C7USA5_9RHOD|nr:hypothetical protein GpartN1_g5647.t1 [Galdieria partita]
MVQPTLGVWTVPTFMENKNQQERVIIWNRKYRRKVGGNAAPFRRNLAVYLQKHPDCEVYCGQDLYREAVPSTRPILPKGLQPLPNSDVGTEVLGRYDSSISRREGLWSSERPRYRDTSLATRGDFSRCSPVGKFWEQKADADVNYLENPWVERETDSRKYMEEYENKSRDSIGSAELNNERKHVEIEQIVDSSDSSLRHISEVSTEEGDVKPALRGICDLASYPTLQFEPSMVSPCLSTPEGSFPFSNSLQTPYSIDSSGSSYSLKERWALLRSEAVKSVVKSSETTQEEEATGSFPGSVTAPSRMMDYEYYSSYHEFR